MSDKEQSQSGWSLQVCRDGRVIQTLALSQEKTFIGRMPQNHVVLDHPAVSRSHASITGKDGKYVLADQGSQNGTLLNGRAIFQQEFKVGDIASIGPFELKLADKAARPTPTTSMRMPEDSSPTESGNRGKNAVRDGMSRPEGVVSPKYRIFSSALSWRALSTGKCWCFRDGGEPPIGTPIALVAGTMPTKINQSLAGKAVIIQSAADQQQRQKLQAMSRTLDPRNSKVQAGGVFIPERAQFASSFQPFSVTGDATARFAKLSEGKKS